MSLTKEDRKDRAVAGRTFPAVRFPDAIAAALHRQYGGTHGAIKTVARVTGANERAVKNWFEAKNGPSGGFLIDLCRNSDEVLETFLLLANRQDQIKVKKVADLKNILRQMLTLLEEVELA
jgi:hypothetical protein